jgi:hypothetical protein
VVPRAGIAPVGSIPTAPTSGLWSGLPVRYFYFNMPRQRHDLPGLMFLDRHVQRPLSFYAVQNAESQLVFAVEVASNEPYAESDYL